METSKFDNVEAHVCSVVSVWVDDENLEITVHIEHPDNVPTKAYLYHMIKQAIKQHMLG